MSTLQHTAKLSKVIDILIRLLGIILAPKTIINLFGMPMVGKSTLALMIARELGENVTVFASEFSYEEPEFMKFLKKVLGDFKFELRYVGSFQELMKALDYIKSKVIIIDSLSALIDRVAMPWAARNVDIRVIAAKIIPQSRIAIAKLRHIVNRNDGYGIIVTHAGRKTSLLS